MFKFHVLGTSSAVPSNGRHLSAHIVEYNDRYYLVDCGEGTQFRLRQHRIKLKRLDAIFISHMHGDHFYGLPGLLSTMGLFDRKRPLTIYCPKVLIEWLQVTYQLSDQPAPFDLHFIATESLTYGETQPLAKKLGFQTLPLVHGVRSTGFKFIEINKSPKFDFYKAKDLGIDAKYFALLKQGNDITTDEGLKVKSSEVLSPPLPVRSFAYCSDTMYNEELVPYLKNVDLLYHEATFMEDMASRAKEVYHSTAKEAAKIAQLAEVKKLLLGHFSARYKELDPLLAEAKTVFEESYIAEEGVAYNLS